MTSEHWKQLKECYKNSVPAADVRFDHRWRGVSTGAEWPSVLKVVRLSDVPAAEEGPLFSLRCFLKYNGGVAMVYPLGFFGSVTGMAFRSISSKEMMSFVRYNDSACFTSSRFYSDGRENFRHWKPVVIVEGFADAEAVARFYPYVLATMGGPLKFALVPLVKLFVKSVYTMMDNDVPGRRAEKLVWARLDKCGIAHGSVKYPKEYKDPDDFYFADPVEMRRRLETVLGC